MSGNCHLRSVKTLSTKVACGSSKHHYPHRRVLEENCSLNEWGITTKVMSSKKSSLVPDSYEVHGFHVQRFKHLVGQLLTTIDAIGLQEPQRQAVKDIVNNHVWRLWEHPSSTHTIENPINAPLS